MHLPGTRILLPHLTTHCAAKGGRLQIKERVPTLETYRNPTSRNLIDTSHSGNWHRSQFHFHLRRCPAGREYTTKNDDESSEKSREGIARMKYRLTGGGDELHTKVPEVVRRGERGATAFRVPFRLCNCCILEHHRPKTFPPDTAQEWISTWYYRMRAKKVTEYRVAK